MKCDRFLAALETGGLVERMQARRHAARCPRCAAARAALAAVKQQLGTCEPLSPRARQLWRPAAGEKAARPSRRRIWMPLAAGLATAAGVQLFIVATGVRKEPLPAPPPATVVHSDAPLATEVVGEVDSGGELVRLAAEVERLDADLQRLRHQAERLEARQQVAMTLDEFGRWPISAGKHKDQGD
jgi:hypothetical protein